MRVAQWGNSLAVRLPVAVVKALRLKPGDEIEAHVAGDRAFAVARKSTQRDFLNRRRAFRGRLPPDFKLDQGDANVNADCGRATRSSR